MDINAIVIAKAKLAFEREAQIHGVMLKGYHNNNGVFNYP